MIYVINGTLIDRQAENSSYSLIIEVYGIGYQVKVNYNTYSHFNKLGQKISLYTYQYVKEDVLELYGFSNTQERNCFKLLISVSGIGPKVAMQILSSVDYRQFATDVSLGNEHSLVKVKGIGEKTAKRIILELKDKVGKTNINSNLSNLNLRQSRIEDSSLSANNNLNQSIDALTVLGYSDTEIKAIIPELLNIKENSVEEIIKIALKLLLK